MEVDTVQGSKKGAELLPEHYREPEDLYNEAQKLMSEKKFDESERIFNFLLGIDRDNVFCLFYLGTIQMHRDNLALGRQILLRCLDLKPDFAEAHNNLGFISDRDNRKQEAEKYFAKAVELHPEAGEFWNNWATIFVNARQPEKAIELCDKALETNSAMLDAKWNKGLANLELRNWVEGWEGYEWGLKDEGKRKNRQYHNKGTPEWPGPEANEERPTVVLYGEQGVGDELMFCTMVKDAMEHADIILECHPRLQRMFRRSFPGIPVYGTRKEKNIVWPNHHKIDYKCALGSLGQYFRCMDEDFHGKGEYLIPETELVRKWKKLLPDNGKPNIGISWKGGTQITRKDLRSVALDLWKPLFESIDANWISLQYTDEARYTLHELELEDTVIHNQDMIDDLDESYCGVVPNLDLVLSVNTSLVHACGALGAECWSLTPWAPAWRYNLDIDKMIWYDSVRLIRQPKKEEDDIAALKWEPVIERVIKDLKSRYAKEAA